MTGPAAYFVFGTNQTLPVDVVADRHQRGLAPLSIVTGGINRNNGIVEGHALRDLLIERGVPEGVMGDPRVAGEPPTHYRPILRLTPAGDRA